MAVYRRFELGDNMSDSTVPESLLLSEYERKYKKYENCASGYILPAMYVVIRIDAHRLNKEEWKAFPDELYPLSEEVHQALIAGARAVVTAEQSYSFSFVHGDEISVLLDTGEREQERRRERIASAVASVASTAFFEKMGMKVIFHAKISELPTEEHAVHYFQWQRMVARRNYSSRQIKILHERGEISLDEQKKVLSGGVDDIESALEGFGHPVKKVPPQFRYGSALWWGQGHSPPTLFETHDLSCDDSVFMRFVQQKIRGRGERCMNGLAGVECAQSQEPAAWDITSEVGERPKTTQGKPKRGKGLSFRGHPHTKVFTTTK